MLEQYLKRFSACVFANQKKTTKRLTFDDIVLQ